MRVSPCYLAAVSDLARDCESGIFPDFELENQASEIGARFGVVDSEVKEDVSAAITRIVAAQPVSPRFFFTDAAGAKREVYVHDDDFFLICIGGIQVGASCGTPQEAEKVVSEHLDDGVASDLITVEAYHQGKNDDEPVETTPFYKDGRWAAEHRAAA